MEITKLIKEAFSENEVWCSNEGYDGYEIAETKGRSIVSRGGDKYIKAKMIFSNGFTFDGYVIDNCDNVMEIVIFLIKDEIVRIHSIFKKSKLEVFIQELENTFALKIEDIFPIKYETNYSYVRKDRIAGSFTLSSKK